LEYLAAHGTDKQRKQAETELNAGSMLGPQPQHLLIDTNKGEMKKNEPQVPMAKGEFLNQSVNNILKDAGSAYPHDEIVEVDN
jgi:hypothetical protein